MSQLKSTLKTNKIIHAYFICSLREANFANDLLFACMFSDTGTSTSTFYWKSHTRTALAIADLNDLFPEVTKVSHSKYVHRCACVCVFFTSSLKLPVERIFVFVHYETYSKVSAWPFMQEIHILSYSYIKI